MISSKHLLFIILFLLSGIVSAQNKRQIIDEVIAVVGNTPILRSELEILITQLDPDIEVTEEVKCDLFQKLLINKMLIHQAEIDSIPLTDLEVEDRIDNNLRFFERQMNSRANVEKYLGMTVAEYKKQIFHKLKAQMLMEKMEQNIRADIKISPKEVKDYYKRIPQDSLPYISSEVEVSQIVIKPKQSKEAIEIAREQVALLKERVIAGESFARLAGYYSEDPGSKNQGGLLPEFGRGEMVPEFERTAFSLQIDSISDVIETPYGFHVLMLVDKRGDRVKVRHILIRPVLLDDDLTLAKQKADSIYQLVQTGKIAWCEAVKQFTDDEETKPFCGYLLDQNIGSQRIPFDYLDKDIARSVSEMKIGQYAEPSLTKAPDGSPYYRILFLKDETKPHVANLEQDWQRIQAMALEDKKDRQMDTWAEKKRKETYIYIKPNYLVCGYFNDWITEK